MRKNAIAIVTKVADGSIYGRIVDPSCEDGLAPEALIRWARPTADKSDILFLTNDGLKADELKFGATAPESGSAIILADAQGISDDGSPAAIVAAYGIVGVCSPAEAKALMDKAKETAKGSFGEHTDWPFQREKGEWLKALPGYVGGSRASPNTALWPITWCEIEHQAEAQTAARQPDEGIVFVDDDSPGTLIAHRGAYLFWEAGNNGMWIDGMGIHPIPKEPGLYYFRGKGWSHCSNTDWGDEYDSGLDVEECVPATDENCAKFGMTLDECRAEVENLLGERQAERAPVQAAAP